MPLEYINEFRLKVATAILASTSRSILEIALSSGFPTLSNFNRLFKAKFNKSPRNYRQDVAKN
jgi:transcriptional regulator GlxA family with amidase domain